MTNSPRFSYRFIYPRYWGIWGVAGVLMFIQLLPRRWIMKLGKRLGQKIKKTNKKRNAIVETNVALCFPHLSQVEKQQFIDSHFDCYGCMLADLGLVMFASQRTRKKYVTTINEHYLTQTLAKHNTLIVTYHTIAFDIGLCVLLGTKKLTGMMRRDKNPLLNWLMYRARTRFGNIELYMRDQGLRGIAQGLKQGNPCALVVDEDIGEGKNMQFSPFFGQEKSLLNTVSRLARLSNAKVIPFIATLNVGTGHYMIDVGAPLQSFPCNDQQDAANLNATMEKMLRNSPEQYMWTFKWFKNQPDGLANPYDEVKL